MKPKMKQPKKKKCKICPNEFIAYSSTQVVCSTSCAVALATKKRQDKILKDWNIEKQKRKKELMTIPEMIALAEREVNEYIRMRDVGKTCVSCSTILTKNVKFDAGHFYSTNYSIIRFDYSNIHGQCVQCNQHKHSNPHEYRRRILQRISQEELDRLDSIAHQTIKWDRDQLTKIIEEAKQKKKLLRETQ